MNKALTWLTCLAATAAVSCGKQDYWDDGSQTYEDIGYNKIFINITAPNNVPNIVIDKADGRTTQLRAAVGGRGHMEIPSISSFVRAQDTVPNNQLTSPFTTDGFYANRESIIEYTEGRTTYRFKPQSTVQGAIILFKGNNLKADSLNTYVIGGILDNSAWEVQ